MIRALLGIGKALGREVILPRMLCYCDFMWKESRAAAASGLPFTAIHRHAHDSQEMRNCRVGGAETMRLPFDCPMDHVLNTPSFFGDFHKNGTEGRTALGVGVREPNFLLNPRVHAAV